ncbi:hypothetical protein Lser_V15G26561 [Lactuca serriola]
MAVPVNRMGDAGPSSSSGVFGVRRRKCRRLASLSVLPEYVDHGDCVKVCELCAAFFWYAEGSLQLSTAAHPRYTHCCRAGSIVLPYPSRFHAEFLTLYRSRNFLKDISAYNSMFSMTSFGANVDKDVNDGHGPYVCKISGQISHKIRSLCLDPTKGPRFLQLYLFDTKNEVQNRLRVFDGPGKGCLDSKIVNFLVEFLGANNEYVRTFKTAKRIAEETNLHSYAVRLFNYVNDRRHDLPSPGSLGCIVSGDDTTSTTYDIVIQSQSGRPQRISKLHPTYMPLQYPLLFPYGEEGWSPRLKISNGKGATAKNLTVNMYYAYHIHARQQIWSPIINSSRLFKQYLVDTYTCIEESRLDYIVKHQSNLWSDYVSGLYDALSKGDREASVVGKRVFLPAYWRSPVYWPEITRYIDAHQQTDLHNRADIITRVFNIKVHDFIRFLKEDKTFGKVEAYLYTIEFQKRCLPHCHTLLWVKSSDRIKNASDVDAYITAELSNPVKEPELFETITTCMIHGQCGTLHQKAPCIKDDKCNKHFPKLFLNDTYFDKQGYVCYKRMSAAYHTTQYGQVIDNGYVVPYNKRLCSRFRAHINVEYCGWSMMIKYLFKYISKGADRVRYTIQKAESLTESSDATLIAGHNSMQTEDFHPINEVHNFLDGRYICPHEAA